MGAYLTGVRLIGVYLIGVYLMGMYLMSVHLMGVYVMGAYLIRLRGAHLCAGCTPVSLRRSRVVHLSTILASFILRTFLVSYSGVLENLGKAFKLVYAKPLRCIAWPAKG